MGANRSINAKTETVDGALTLGKRALPTWDGGQAPMLHPGWGLRRKKGEGSEPGCSQRQPGHPSPPPSFYLHPENGIPRKHSNRKRTPKINKPTPTQWSGVSLVMGRGRSLGTALDRGQGTLSGKFKAEKSIHRIPPLVSKDKKDNLFIFQKVT